MSEAPRSIGERLADTGCVVEVGPLRYAFANLLALGAGEGGVALEELAAALPAAARAYQGFEAIRRTGRAPSHDEQVLFPRLPFVEAGGPNSPEVLGRLEAWADARREAEAVVSFGIGGSYLGNRVLQDGLLGPRWSDLPREGRGGRPRVYFSGYDLDAAELTDLVELIASRRTPGAPLRVEALAISKSGGTVETMAAFLAFRDMIGAREGLRLGVSAMTDPTSPLGELARAFGGEVLPFPEGIGGRFSVLSSSGLVTARAAGIDVRALLAGAREVAEGIAGAGGDPLRDPALLFALVHHLAAGHGKRIGVFMPYSARLRPVAEWYVQLLAESLGKKLDRGGRPAARTGRTPLVAVGTTDMHAQTQQHQEGERDKTVTFLDVREAPRPLVVPRAPVRGAVFDRIAGRDFAVVNAAAREANEEALRRDGRPSDTILMERLDERSIGALLFLLMASVAYEGELLGVNAYDQPGVEGYKGILKEKLGRG